MTCVKSPGRFRAAGVLAVMIAAVGVACGGGSGKSSDARSLGDVFKAVEAAMSEPGMVVNVVATFDIRLPEEFGGNSTQKHEYWVNGAEKSARFKNDKGELSIFIDKQRYFEKSSTVRPADNLECLGLLPIVTAIVGGALCHPDYRAMGTTRVESGQYEGKKATVVASDGEFGRGAEQFDVVFKLYISPESNLALGYKNHLQSQSKADKVNETITTFDTEVVARDSLPADFFEPASIGYIEP